MVGEQPGDETMYSLKWYIVCFHCSPSVMRRLIPFFLDLPNDKAPRPDSFNGHFVNKTWHIIRQEFYTLCTDLFHHEADIKSLNYSYVTLVAKKENPKCMNYFRPISLLNTSIKIITKLLANRLQRVIPQIVHDNQHGFIKGKSILDCLG